MSDLSVDIRSLPTQPRRSDAPEWWGIAALVVIEGVVFIGLIASYFHLKLRNAEWPPPGIEDPELLLPTLNTLLLIASAVPIYMAVRGMRDGSDRRARIALPIGMLMLLVFLGLKVYEYGGKPWGITSNAYGSAVMLMTGLHMAHVLAVTLKTAVIYQYIRSGRVEPERPGAVESNAVYWYFVIAVWLPLYTTIYLSPRFLP